MCNFSNLLIYSFVNKSKCKKAESQNRKIKEPVCDSAFLLMDIVYFTLTEEVLLQVE